MKHVFSLILLVWTFVACNSKRNGKAELVCKNGNEKITIEIENGKDFLVYDQPTQTDFVVKKH